jgi:hypothetical protein
MTQDEKLALIQSAIENMPYREGFEKKTHDTRESRPTTLREFFENTWQGDYADELFPKVARAVLQAIEGGADKTEGLGPQGESAVGTADAAGE